MKTAMKEMLLNIEALEAITTDQEQIYMLTHLKVGALVLFKKEKEQIIDAFWNGDNSDCTSEQNAKEFAEEYLTKLITKIVNYLKRTKHLRENHNGQKQII